MLILPLELRTIMRRFTLCWLATLILITGCKKDVSGSYLGVDKVAVCWLQLARTPDAHVTGQLVSSVLKSDGTIDRESVPLTGAANGGDITLVGGGFLGMAATTLSGTFDSNTLTITGAQATPVTLRRGTLADYQAELREQTARSQAIIALRVTAAARQRTFQAQQRFVTEVDQAIGRMQRFENEADVHLGRFPSAEKDYEAITSKVDVYVTRERQLVGNPDRLVNRSQLSVAATQVALNTDQMHVEGQALQSSLETNIAPLVSETAALEQGCRQSGPQNQGLTPAEAGAHETACSRLLGAAPAFYEKDAAVRIGLSRLEEVFKREKEAQARLLAAAGKME